MANTPSAEGGLEAPTRFPIPWRTDDFYDETKLNAELFRVFDICHGCRRCVNLCEAFPTLFDLIDESKNYDVESVDTADYSKVSEQCYLCGMCYQSKCPYVPPHKWEVDFPHLMLRAKALAFRKKGARIRDRVITSTDTIGNLIHIGRLQRLYTWFSGISLFRLVAHFLFGIHKNARLPQYARAKAEDSGDKEAGSAKKSKKVKHKVAIFKTCYGKWNEPGMVADLAAILKHNGVETRTLDVEWCCAMPKLDLGDLKAVERHKDLNLKAMADVLEQGYAIIALVPSCVYMFKEELPLMFPEDPQLQNLSQNIFDPFEYLHKLHQEKSLKTNFVNHLGKVAHQNACHQRVQNIGNKTKDILSLIPQTDVHTIERCTGHDGTYALKAETYDHSMKIVAPVAKQVKELAPETYTSDCPLSAGHITHALGDDKNPPHPITLLRHAYGI